MEVESMRERHVPCRLLCTKLKLPLDMSTTSSPVRRMQASSKMPKEPIILLL
jgi:hypothetical protein